MPRTRRSSRSPVLSGGWEVRGSCLVAAALSILFACRTPPPLTPADLAGMPRSRVEEGEAARRAIGALHGKQVAPLASAIAEYGGDGTLTLYASRFGDPAEAERALETMLGRLREGSTPFAAPVPHPAHPGVWLTKGPGGHHALLRSRDRLLWVQGAAPLVDRASAELVRRR